jgi:hypothetical protein
MGTSPTDNSTPERLIPESVYRQHLIRARSTRNHFIVSRDWVLIMPWEISIFIQDLLNRAAGPKTKRKTIKGDDGVQREFFLCTSKYLSNSRFSWADRTQKKYISWLKTAGFVKLTHFGVPPRRWIWVDIIAIEDKVDEVLKTLDKNTRGHKVPFKAGTKCPLKEAQNAPLHNNNGQIQTKDKEINTPPPSETSFDEPLLKKKKVVSQQESPHAKRWATRLYEEIKRKKLLNPNRSKLPDWIKITATLLTKGPKDGPVPTIEQVDFALDWLIPNITEKMEEKFLPVVFCAQSFVDKFWKIYRKAVKENGELPSPSSSLQVTRWIDENGYECERISGGKLPDDGKKVIS